MKTDTSYLYLENLHHLIKEKPDVSQRDVSKALHMSLGMTNSLLKRFAEKGWIYMHKINAKNIRYALTPDGLNALAERSYTYIKRTMKSVVRYRDIFIQTVTDAKKHGCTEAFLVGETDLFFLLEHACEKNALKLKQVKKIPEQNTGDKQLVFFADTTDYDALTPLPKNNLVYVDIFKLFH